MVHALKTIHGLLNPEGRLIDIHPAARPSAVTIRSGRQTTLIGYLHENGGFVDYQLAEAALEDVVDEGLFRWEMQSEFDHSIVAKRASEMFAHLETEWKRAILDDDLRRAIERGMASSDGTNELMISQPVCIGSLRLVTSGTVS